MGTLRKMGAFLGLVPDDPQRYDRDGGDDHPADGHGSSPYAPVGYGTDSQGSYGDSSYSDSSHGDPAYGHDAYGDGTDRDYADTAHGTNGYGDSGHGTDDGGHTVGWSEDPVPVGATASAGHDELDAADHGRSASRRSTRARERVSAGAESLHRPQSRTTASARGADQDYSTQGSLAVQPAVQIESITAESPAGQKPATVSLTGFADAREVGEFYRAGQAVILDMTDLTDAEARRMVDFAAGLAFAVRGSIDKVTTKVFMLHPPTADHDSGGR